MSKPSEVIILAEDQTQQRLVYWYLRRLGINRHVIRGGRLPAGKGSGGQWVRQSYANSVKAYRVKSASVDKALVVMIDADTSTAKERLKQLSDTLKEAGLQPIAEREKVVHLTPKRNVETWILCLNGQTVNGEAINEDENYKPFSRSLKIEEQIKPAAEIFFDWSRRNFQPPAHCIASLHAAIVEVQRLET